MAKITIKELESLTPNDAGRILRGDFSVAVSSIVRRGQSAERRRRGPKGVRDFCVTFSRTFKHYWAFGCSERQ